MHLPDRDALLSSLLLSPRCQALWDVRDRGMPVFVHQLDVALLAIERRLPHHDVDALVLGALIHDASKMPRPDEPRSHSLLMRADPDAAADVSMELLADAERRSGVAVDAALREHVRHIVLSHHGKHGRVQPATSEARLVVACDLYSGTHHRLAPIDANDVLPLLAEGYRWKEAAALLGTGRELVKTRLREACEAEAVREWVELLPIWRARGQVATGDAAKVRHMAGAKQVTRLAHQVPDCLIERLSPVRLSVPALVQ